MLRRVDWRSPAVCFALVAAAGLAALYLVNIGGAPPGLYDDEASIGYNAWTIAHFGVDQYGNHLPLFFVDFGDYKGPLATYLVAPLTYLLPAGATVVRLPSVLAGIAVFVVAGLLARRLTKSAGIAIAAMALTALQPWLFLQSHTMLEGNVLMVLCVVLACWCIAEAATAANPARWWTAAGIALGAAVYAYSIGRLLALLLAAAAVLSYRRIGRRLLLRFLFPIAVAYVVLGVWMLRNPGALTQRLQTVGILSDHPALLTAVGRFFANYASYFSPGFLSLSGDGNLRQTTGFGGVLLGVALPLVLIGAVVLIRRWREPFARFVLLGALLAPIPAALTLQAPHALRGAGLFPFITVMMIEGIAWVAARLRRRAVLAGLASLAVLSATPYLVDFFAFYPARAANAFETGETDALRMAYAQSVSRHDALYVSASLNQPAMQLMYAVSAVPPQDAFLRSARFHIVDTPADMATAVPGDVLVLGGDDVPPTGATLEFSLRDGAIVRAPDAPSGGDLLRVYVR